LAWAPSICALLSAAFNQLNTKLRQIRTLLEALDWRGYRVPKVALALLPQCLDQTPVWGLQERHKKTRQSRVV